MKRFFVFLVFGVLAYWMYWYTYSVDPGGDGFGFEPCSDGEGGVCSSDPSVFTFILFIVFGIVAFIALLMCFSYIRKKLKGEPVGAAAKPKNRGFSWVDTSTAAVTQWGNQISSGIQQAHQAQQQWTQSMPTTMGVPGQPAPGGNATMPGQAGVIGGPAAGSPAAGNPAARAPAAGRPAGSNPSAANPAMGEPATRTPTAADRAASRERWLKRSAESSALDDLPSIDPVPAAPIDAPTPAPAPTHTPAPAAPTPSTPATADLVLVTVGPRDMGVQREVRRITGLGLDDAKALLASVAQGPQVVATGLPYADAEDAKRTFDKMGAAVELR